MFQVDHQRFPRSKFMNLSNFCKNFFENLYLLLKARHIVPIVDVGIYPNLSDYTIVDAINNNLFINSDADEIYMGRCWPGISIFPDFFHPEIRTFWNKNLKKLYEYMNFSGIWLDMNEFSSFCDGECGGNHKPFLHQIKKV